MLKPRDPRDLVIDLIPRSICAVQVAAVIADNHGIHSWGWNSVGSGFGEHAEAAAIRRSNRDRLEGSILYVASRRKHNGKYIFSMPCDRCCSLIAKYGFKDIIYMVNRYEWKTL